ncbi:tRNA pseudouridine synthase 1 [Rhizophlyctis rosea]|nr:tRNA pseudouridine synthase 1 [Rhizophlyctis rosea]
MSDLTPVKTEPGTPSASANPSSAAEEEKQPTGDATATPANNKRTSEDAAELPDAKKAKLVVPADFTSPQTQPSASVKEEAESSSSVEVDQKDAGPKAMSVDPTTATESAGTEVKHEFKRAAPGLLPKAKDADGKEVKKKAWDWLQEEKAKLSYVKPEQPTDEKGEKIKLPKKKVALLMSYCGAGYTGMQLNPGVATIEFDLHKALAAAGAVSDDNAFAPHKISFMRAARTDKGVHAAGQVVSLKMICEDPEIIQKINSFLPPAIRVWGWVRVNKGFHSKNACDSRWYEYLLPTYVLQKVDENLYPYSAYAEAKEIKPEPKAADDYGDWNELPKSTPEQLAKKKAFRATPKHIDKFRQILKMYVGSHNYHNYTHGKKFEAANAYRNIKEFTCTDPFVRGDMEWVSCKVHGQSFMLHQIRKMIGMAVMMVRTWTGNALITHSFHKEKLNIPKAPGLGLLLEKVVYDSYNSKIRKASGTEAEKIDLENYRAEVNAFKEQYIYADLIKEESERHVFDEWLRVIDSRPEDYGWFLNPDGSVAMERRPMYIVERRAGGKLNPNAAKEEEAAMEVDIAEEDDGNETE